MRRTDADDYLSLSTDDEDIEMPSVADADDPAQLETFADYIYSSQLSVRVRLILLGVCIKLNESSVMQYD